MRNLLAICVLFLFLAGCCCLDTDAFVPPVVPESNGDEFKPDFNKMAPP